MKSAVLVLALALVAFAPAAAQSGDEIEFKHPASRGASGGPGEPGQHFNAGVYLLVGTEDPYSPLNDLTERPTVNRQIMPSTLSESGMGFFGTFYPSELSVATYEVYVVNGFNAKVINSSGALRIRGGRGSQKSDNNENKAITGRFGLSPRLGMNFGASFHTGAYDNAGDNNLTIFAAARLPPALSPTRIKGPSKPSPMRRKAVVQSSNAAGWECSGANL